jgi:hypothetical protein
MNIFKGVYITINTGQKCNFGDNEYSNYTVDLMLKCDALAKPKSIKPLNPSSFSALKCHNVLEFELAEACPITHLYTFREFIINNKDLVGVALMGIGLEQIFFGSKFFMFTAILMVTIITITFISLIAFTLISIIIIEPIIWIIIGFSTLLGLIMSYLVIKYYKSILSFLLSVYKGYFLGIILYVGVTSNIQIYSYVKKII